MSNIQEEYEMIEPSLKNNFKIPNKGSSENNMNSTVQIMSPEDAEMDANYEDKHFKWVNMICFAIAGFPYHLMFSSISVYSTKYLLDEIKIAAKYTSIILFVSRAMDAITDPIYGYLINKTKITRFGKMKPWIAVSLPLTVMSYIFMWYAPDVVVKDETYKIVWFGISFAMFFTFITGYRIPHTSMTMYLSRSKKKREQATVMRMGFEMFGILLSLVIQSLIVGAASKNCENITTIAAFTTQPIRITTTPLPITFNTNTTSKQLLTVSDYFTESESSSSATFSVGMTNETSFPSTTIMETLTNTKDISSDTTIVTTTTTTTTTTTSTDTTIVTTTTTSTDTTIVTATATYTTTFNLNRADDTTTSTISTTTDKQTIIETSTETTTDDSSTSTSTKLNNLDSTTNIVTTKTLTSFEHTNTSNDTSPAEPVSFFETYRYLIAALIFSGVYIIADVLLLYGAKENIDMLKENEKNKDDQDDVTIIQELKTIFTFKPFILLAVSAVCTTSASQIVQAYFQLYFEYSFVEANKYFLYAILTVLTTSVLMVPVWQILMNKFGKRQVYIVGNFMLAPFLIASWFFRDEPYHIYIFFALAFIGANTFTVGFVLPWSMLPECLDAFFLKYNRKPDALFYTFLLLGTKIVISVYLGVGQYILDEVGGYLNNICYYYQPASVDTVIRLLLAPIPLVLVILSSVCVYFYPLTTEIVLENAKKLNSLDNQKNKSSITPVAKVNPQNVYDNQNVSPSSSKSSISKSNYSKPVFSIQSRENNLPKDDVLEEYNSEDEFQDEFDDNEAAYPIYENKGFNNDEDFDKSVTGDTTRF